MVYKDKMAKPSSAIGSYIAGWVQVEYYREMKRGEIKLELFLSNQTN